MLFARDLATLTLNNKINLPWDILWRPERSEISLASIS